MESIIGELVNLFKEELRHCNLKSGETVLIFSDSTTNREYPAAFFGAAQDLGAHVFEMRVPYLAGKARSISKAGREDVLPPKGPIEAMKAADLVIDLASINWLYTEVHNEVLRSGTRTLMVHYPPDILRRLLPDDSVKRRTIAGANILKKGKRIRLTSPAGTDLTFDKTGRKAIGQYGASDVPGRWDHWPSGDVACAPLEDSTDGVLVIDKGDILLRINRYVSEPIRCEFRNARMTRIEGGLDALLMREYMETWKDDRIYIPAHVGWGTDHRAIWIELALPGQGGGKDAESSYGTVLFGMGANYFVQFGGENVTEAHLDICLRNCSFWVDDLQILKDGKILPEELK